MLSVRCILVWTVICITASIALAKFDHAHISWAEKCNVQADYSPYVQIGGKHYIIESEQKANWFGAGQYCRRHGGYLADIESDAELNALNEVLLKTYSTKPQYFWLSGTDLSVEGQFVSSATGHPLKYFKWSPSQPDNLNEEDCLGLLHRDSDRFLMNDYPCSWKMSFICELRPGNFVLSVW